jgi:hypothetical protein
MTAKKATTKKTAKKSPRKMPARFTGSAAEIAFDGDPDLDANGMPRWLTEPVLPPEKPKR